MGMNSNIHVVINDPGYTFTQIGAVCDVIVVQLVLRSIVTLMHTYRPRWTVSRQTLPGKVRPFLEEEFKAHSYKYRF